MIVPYTIKGLVYHTAESCRRIGYFLVTNEVGGLRSLVLCEGGPEGPGDDILYGSTEEEVIELGRKWADKSKRSYQEITESYIEGWN